MEAEMTDLLGAYEVVKKTKVFPECFWAVMVIANKDVIIETAAEVRRVEVSQLERAIDRGDVRLMDR